MDLNEQLLRDAIKIMTCAPVGCPREEHCFRLASWARELLAAADASKSSEDVGESTQHGFDDDHGLHG